MGQWPTKSFCHVHWKWPHPSSPPLTANLASEFLIQVHQIKGSERFCSK